MLPSRVEASDYEYIVKLLQEYSEAKVITLFLEHSVLYTFFHQMEMHDMFHNHIWFGTDTIHSLTKNKFEGIFTLAYPVSSAIKELRDALESWSPLTDPENPWVYEMWQNLYNCAWHQSRQTSRWCGDFLNTTYPIMGRTNSYHLRMIDSVMVYAKALHNLIYDNCKDMFQKIDGDVLNSCIKGDQLLSYMKRTRFNGSSGKIRFDANGNVMGAILYQQRQRIGGHIQMVTVGKWSKTSNNAIRIYTEKLKWFVTRDSANVISTKMVPTSLCSLPCSSREQIIPKVLPCCWECRPCRNHEHVTGNGTECEPCEEYTWPSTDGTKCQVMEPEYIRWSDPIAACFIALSLFGLLGSISTLAFFIKHKGHKLVRASSRELMAITIFGIILAYLTVFMFIAEPSNTICILSLYNLVSISIIYIPVLLKCNRVYRIFSIKKTGQTMIHCISQRSQIALVLSMITFMVSP